MGLWKPSGMKKAAEEGAWLQGGGRGTHSCPARAQGSGSKEEAVEGSDAALGPPRGR